MKRSLLILSTCALMGFTSMAQIVIYDNGPIMNLPGGGFGGADVSHLHDGMNSLGSNHSFAGGYRVADDIVIPAGQSWNIDSLVFYSYQTQAANNTTSTMLDVNVRIWDGIPGDPGSNIVFGDETTNRMNTSDWAGAYRTADFISTTCPPATCTQRAIMRNSTITGTTLSAGTYWIDWQSNGSLTSGPWAPLINLGVGVTTSGNALQYVPSTQIWQASVDTVPANAGNPPYEPQGYPFLVVGSIITGVATINTNNNVSISPNPVSDRATISINIQMEKSAVYTFHLYDILGNTLQSNINITNSKTDFDRGSLPDGVYFYKINMNNKVLKMGKLVLQ